ncbi:MAG: hypothetical protein ABJ000_10850 [Saccharospirillum sp.]|uniref:hypothetical protein n=1 Tax=Saccharospirillum sp. TaxID=2033801 RepID=UPI003299C594
MRLWLLIYVFFLSACTTSSEAETHRDSLYETFQEFRSLVVEDYTLATEAMISDEYVARTRQAQENMPQELRSPYFENLAKKIQTEHSHFEKMGTSEGCLTINGLDDQKRPKSLSLYYIKENGKWVFDSIMVAGHQTVNDYYNQAMCPDLE